MAVILLSWSCSGGGEGTSTGGASGAAGAGFQGVVSFAFGVMGTDGSSYTGEMLVLATP